MKGTPFNLTVWTSGTAGELARKNAEMRKLQITTGGVYIYKGNEKIALLKTIELDRGVKPKLGEVQTFVDLKELLRREYPGQFTDAVANILRNFDNAVDAFNRYGWRSLRPFRKIRRCGGYRPRRGRDRPLVSHR